MATAWPAGTKHNFSRCCGFILVFLSILLLNGFFEELLIRGYLTTEVAELGGTWLWASLISLAVQTSYHLYYGVARALIIGAGLSVFVIYYGRSKRLMPVVLAHTLWDIVAAYNR